MELEKLGISAREMCKDEKLDLSASPMKSHTGQIYRCVAAVSSEVPLAFDLLTPLCLAASLLAAHYSLAPFTLACTWR